MKRQIKFSSQEQQSQAQQDRTAAREFATAEELLRHDALHTPVPPTIAHRLKESIAQIPAPPRPWWRRLFGK